MATEWAPEQHEIQGMVVAAMAELVAVANRLDPPCDFTNGQHNADCRACDLRSALKLLGEAKKEFLQWEGK